MSDLNASLYHLQNTQSIAFKFFSDSVKEIERQIRSTAGLNFFTPEQIDFIVLICDQFQKLVQLRSKSELIDNLLTFHFPEFFKPVENVPSTLKPVTSKTVELSEKGSHISFVCDVCDEDVPILNNDIDYSTQLHLSSPYHQEVVSVLRKIKENEKSASSLNSVLLEPQCGPSKVSSVSNVPNGHEFASRIVSNSKTTQKQSPEPNIISEKEEDFQRFSWIQSQRQNQYLIWRRSQYYCCLCDANLPTQHNFDAHVRSFTHKTNVSAERYLENANVGATKTGSGKSQVATPARSTTSDLSGTSQVRNSTESDSDQQNNKVIVIVNGVRVCTLCDVRMPSEANFQAHTNSFTHRAKLNVFRKTYNSLTKALNDKTNSAGSASSSTSVTNMKSSASSTSAANVKSNAAKNETSNAFQDYLVTLGGTQYCSLCNVKVPGKAQLDSHFNGSLHKEKLKTAPKKPASKAFTDFIITKENKKYCILCNINLPGESQLTGHKYGKTHRQKLEEYEQKYLS